MCLLTIIRSIYISYGSPLQQINLIKDGFLCVFSQYLHTIATVSELFFTFTAILVLMNANIQHDHNNIFLEDRTS